MSFGNKKEYYDDSSKDFCNEIGKVADLFFDKNIITLIMQSCFSGDGAAVAARMLKKQKIKCIASIHINMQPNSGSNRKKLKIDEKIDKYAKIIFEEKSVRNCRQIYF